MIKLESVKKRYFKCDIFDNVNLFLNRAGVYFIRGKNGVGKSTLLRIIAKISNCNGKVKNQYCNKMGYLWQNSTLIKYFTIKEHLELFNINLTVLSEYDLIGKENLYPNELSDGERQRLGFILAMKSDNKLVLLDEPFSNVDNNKVSLMKQEIIKNKKNKIIIIISHNFKIIEDLVDGIIDIKENKVKYIRINDNKVIYSDQLSKRKVCSNSYKKELDRYKHKYLKLFSLSSLLLLLVFIISMSKVIVYKWLDNDINNSVEYNKFYLRKCEDIINNGYKISKCDGVEESKLKELNINYKYNYDYIFSYFYNNEKFKVMDIKNIDLKYGRYPLMYNEVIASDEYNIGDKLMLESNMILGNALVDFYKDEIEVEVVGIYHNLKFNSDTNLYFDYDLIYNHYETKRLINNDMNMNEYYNSLDLGQYKYLIFENIIKDDIEVVGNKYEFYKGMEDVIYKIFELVDKLKIFIIIILLYSFIKINKSLVMDKQKSFGYLISNGYSKYNLIFNNLKIYFIMFSLVYIILALTLLFVSKKFDSISTLTLTYLCLLIICVFQYLRFLSKKRISNLMREEI